jgi:hypothetical protein
VSPVLPLPLTPSSLTPGSLHRCNERASSLQWLHASTTCATYPFGPRVLSAKPVTYAFGASVGELRLPYLSDPLLPAPCILAPAGQQASSFFPFPATKYTFAPPPLATACLSFPEAGLCHTSSFHLHLLTPAHAFVHCHLHHYPLSSRTSTTSSTHHQQRFLWH